MTISLALAALAASTLAYGASHSGTITHAALAASATKSAAGSTPLPLTQYSYAYADVPYQVNPHQYLRGPQASTVAYCTKNTHGARTIRPGAITGLQFMKTSAYIQLIGFVDQTALMLQANDTGGELDPHGADLLGNPLGGLVYSSALPSAKDNSTMMQVVEWNNFIGGGQFCIKLCDPTVTSKNYCQNIFDILGCAYNMPANYVDKEFTSCEGELQDEVATYTDSTGKTVTWSQPSILPATSTLPWTPRIPASSNCVTYKSTDILGVATSSAATSASTGAAASSGASVKSASSAASTASKLGASSAAASGSVTPASSASKLSTEAFLALAAGILAVLV